MLAKNMTKGENASKDLVRGTWYAILAFGIWGILPVYWKLFKTVSPYEIVAHRIIWSCLLTGAFILVTGRWSALVQVFGERKKMAGVIGCAFLLCFNWTVFIYAVNAGHVLDTSLGYYINPLISVFLGLVILKEKVNLWQKVAILLALAAVVVITIDYGRLPWISLSLPLSFGLYGLIKKTGGVDSFTGLTLETFWMIPVALFFLFGIPSTGDSMAGGFLGGVPVMITTGVVTALPLLFFAMGAKRIPLNRVGFIHYLTPTCFFVLGRFVYHEPFSLLQFSGFILIWIALAIYSFLK